MSDDQDVAPRTVNLAPSQQPNQRRGGFLGCMGRLLSALLVVLITTSLALLAIASVYYFGLGLSLDTPDQIREARHLAVTLQAQNSTLQLQQSLLQTQVTEMERRALSDREQLDELRVELATLSRLSDQLTASDARSSTVVAEVRASRDAVMLYATAEAGRAELLSELRRRSERIERFLQRLQDISDDAVSDLGSSAPIVSPSPLSPTQETPLSLGVPSDIPTPTPTDISPETSGDTPTPTMTPTPAERLTATPSPTRRRPTPTP